MKNEVLDFIQECLPGTLYMVGIELFSEGFVPFNNATFELDRTYVVVVGVVGKLSGRIILRVGESTAASLITAMNFGEPLEDATERCLYLAEFTNILVGRLTTSANNAFEGLELRLAPPAVFSGCSVIVTTPNITSIQKTYRTSSGNIYIDLGLEGANATWS